MPDTKASALAAGTVLHPPDLIIGVDVTDTSMAASGTTKWYSPAIVAAGLPVFGASGGSHAQGVVPDPGASAGTTRYLREDAIWFVPPGGGGGTPGGSTGQLQYNNAGAFGGAVDLAVGANGQLAFTAISDPTPGAGDVWYSASQAVLSFVDAGLTTRATGVLWQGLSAGTAVANSTSLTSLLAGIGTQQGSLTLPANSLKVGKCFRFHIFGTVGSTASPTLTVQILMGSTIIMQGTSTALGTAGSGLGWYMQTPAIQIQAIGASGKAIGCGTLAIFQLGTVGMGATGLNTAPAQVTVDTTISQTWDVKVQWSAASASNTIQFLGGFLEVFG
jgi:hypothetical protein